MNDNKLIAEFMEVHEIMHDGYSEYDFDDNTLDVVAEEELQYHTSWDWLMPVVEKIRVPYNNTEITGEKYEDIISVLAEGCIEANQLQVYEAVVEFINEYNKNKYEYNRDA